MGKPTEFYVTIERAAANTPIHGENASKIVGLKLDFQVTSPRDPATGTAMGKRQYGPVTITKAWDPASPELFEALVNNEVLAGVRFEFVRTDVRGAKAVFQTMKLTDAYVARIHRMADLGPQGSGEFEEVSFTFAKIEIADQSSKLQATDDWTGGKQELATGGVSAPTPTNGHSGWPNRSEGIGEAGRAVGGGSTGFPVEAQGHEASASHDLMGSRPGISIPDALPPLFSGETSHAGTPTSKMPRSAAIAEATAMIDRFRTQTDPGRWNASLDRAAVADRLLALINNPDLVDQTGNGLCGEAAFFNIWLWEDPLAVARFGVQLYNGGAAAVGTEEWVRPRPSLRGQNFDNVVTQINRPNARAAIAEWMMMSALRDANNYVFSYDGLPSDKWGAGSSDGELARWLRATNLFSSVSAKTGRSDRHNFDHASQLMPGNDVIMISCDSHMLGNPTSASITDDHWFVLRSAITDHGATVDFRFWSWGEPIQWVNDRRADANKVGTPLPGDLQKTQFTAEYFGYLIAKR